MVQHGLVPLEEFTLGNLPKRQTYPRCDIHQFPYPAIRVETSSGNRRYDEVGTFAYPGGFLDPLIIPAFI